MASPRHRRSHYCVQFSGRGVGQDMREMEHDTMKFALEQTNGKVTAAARLLGMSHQKFRYAINTRYKDLQDLRKPPRQSKPKE